MYYVYYLRNSLEKDSEGKDKVIYVGKGTGNRLNCHVRFVLNGYNNRKDHYLHNKIRKIYAREGKVSAERIYETPCEEKAFAREVEEIRRIGHPKLCNIAFGGEGAVLYDYRCLNTFKEIVLSNEDRVLLKHSYGRSPSECRSAASNNKPSRRIPVAATIIYETFPEAVKDIVSKEDPLPYVFQVIPLTEVIVLIQYNIPNYH
ncbi:MAG: hypothetical protein EXS30_08905 [Pedosphaera sp.]|nr:hypothetical protein [Pedosphaera sp.]